MSVNLDLTNKLERSSKEIYVNGMAICLKLLENIINNPKEEKFRKFKKTNPKIASSLMLVSGIEELLLDMGFELVDNEFILRRGGLGVISKLKAYRDFLQKRMNCIMNDSADKKSTDSSKGAVQKSKSAIEGVPQIRIVADKPFHERINFPQTLKTNNQFLKSLEYLSDSVMQYEDESLKKSGLLLIPMEKLRLNAIENLRSFQKLIKEKTLTDDEPALDDFILEELAAWFKNDFFTWINSMNCKSCKGETNAYGTILKGGIRVEQYLCLKCNVITEFPRYNDIEKLLITRSGRCGEFANCFTFFCRCLGYDARYIYSTSDHVWTEVYNFSKKRFIHVDPSENVFDSPLMYEHGWKRELEYVIAFACDDVQDVTWRYSNQHEELTKRRKRCSEGDLISAIIELRSKRQSNISAARKKFLKMRTISELAELMIKREPNENEKRGRSSGSLQWRLQRGETNVSNNYIFRLTPVEIESKAFNLRYTCSKNQYERFTGQNEIVDSTSDWKTWVFKYEEVFRKVENDHKMVYLARTEDAQTGMIEWKFDFGDLSIKSANITFETATFNSGKMSINYKDQNELHCSKEELIGKSAFSIIATLTGGSGDCAWQHAQIFRQKLQSEDFPFQISLTFN